MTPFGLRFDYQGNVSIQLPPGLSTDFDQIYVFVQIFDDSESMTVFNLEMPIVVKTNPVLANSLMDSLLTNDPNSTLASKILTGDLHTSASNIVSFAALLNNPVENSSAVILDIFY